MSIWNFEAKILYKYDYQNSYVLSFSTAKRKNQRKPTTKTNSKFFFHTFLHTFLPKNLQFALFVDAYPRALAKVRAIISLCRLPKLIIRNRY